MPMLHDDWVSTRRYNELRTQWKQARRDGATVADWATWSARALGPETVGELAAKRQAAYESRNQADIARQDAYYRRLNRDERDALEAATRETSAPGFLSRSEMA
jgi:hypothetical protein